MKTRDIIAITVIYLVGIGLGVLLGWILWAQVITIVIKIPRVIV